MLLNMVSQVYKCRNIVAILQLERFFLAQKRDFNIHTIYIKINSHTDQEKPDQIVYICPIRKLFERKIVIIFLTINLNMCFEYLIETLI